MARAKIDDDRLRELWATDTPNAEIGAEFDVTAQAVRLRAKLIGLPRRTLPRRDAQKTRPRKYKPDPNPEPAPRALPKLPPHPKFGDDRDAAIFRTEGNYGDLSALARKWRLPTQLVQQRYHRLNTAHA